ncbi:protein-disulfide reductase DsbD family protein [Sphingomonas sp. AOB5]|uniref:protein-disulfide reductase DsbD family protein n=1 Tax=Sphingomonas sp. AOB5 TaxID=3034017 RepID=UPI0023F63F87|nr:thioredoxin family protein [Sphingomonas sp. AOB5]MDF7777091.1 protein-disulfide reductase DsbD family protein [Sphingomonas sp. AOB5]
MTRLRFWMMTVLLALIAAPAIAQKPGDGPHVRIALVAESDTPAPGSEVTLAFVSTPEPKWHAYWRNPGDAGIPPKATWTLPEGLTAGEIRYPVPQRLLIVGLMNYVYEHPFATLVTLKLPAGMTAGTKLPVSVDLAYLVCTDEICVPEKATLSTVLTVGDGAVSGERRTQFDGYRTALPKPLGSQGTYQVANGGFRLAIPYPADAAASEVYFFPITDGVVDYAAPQTVARDGDRLVIETKAKASTAPGPIEGVLAVGKDRGFAVTATPGAVAAASAAPVQASGEMWLTALAAFGGAILGGLLLNIMPCVFPILSLKALSLAKANEEGGRPRADALAYTAGVVLVCLALGGVLLALRAGGATLGWAFQLQDPRVIMVLLLLVTGIALNLAGLFEILAPAALNRIAGRSTGGSFMTGALAAFIATPCTGPFMGVALGAALVLPWPAALAIFGGLGLGLALPFLLLGFVPALRRMLPKPGAWMDTFRKILSIPMFLTAIALAWVLGKQIGVDGMAMGLLVALGLSLVLWGMGRKQARGLGTGFGWVMVAVVTVAGVWLVSRTPVEARTAAKAPAGAEPFTEARLAELTAQGRPVFAYFTADWCVTCKVNEKAVIETEAVSKALADGNVAVLVGDWTDGDATLGRFIEKHNRAGVPLYLWYKPGQAAPEVLPQILTQSMMQDRAAGK